MSWPHSMNVFYEEDGSFKVASILAENPGSLQVESVSGKRSKIKLASVILRFDGSLSAFMEQAQTLAAEQEVPFIWECCGDQEFAPQDFALDYYGHKPSPVEVAALTIALHSAPIYFHRKGKGRYRAAPADILQAALAGQEKRRLQMEQMAQWTEMLLQHQFPMGWQSKLAQLLYAPDKNTIEWKALDQASLQSKQSPLLLLDQAGAIPSHEQYHFGAFVREFFSEGTDFPDALMIEQDLFKALEQLPKAVTPAFSIDDITTTEIDDAFSILALEDGAWRVGIHIAAPALAVKPNTALDSIVQQRLSTVYMPGNKITMLPNQLVSHFSLDEGIWRPALSLYLDIDAEFQITAQSTKLEQVMIADNLRHDAIEPYFNEQNCMQDSGHAYWSSLNLLYRFALTLEKARGKADSQQNTQRDYSFYVEAGRVRIVERRRGTPIDKLVSELMIAVNQHWGAWLAQHKIAGIYRAQQNSKVYMTLRAEPHQGLGVPQYAWSSSPLRRAIDLFNQRQLISIVTQQAAPYSESDDVIGGVMRRFDMVYQQYREFQTRMERYWCLQYLRQEQLETLTGVVWRENLVRIDGMPYLCKVSSLPNLPSGTHVSLHIEKIDTLNLHLSAKFVAQIEGEIEPVILDEESELMLAQEATQAATSETDAASSASENPTQEQA